MSELSATIRLRPTRIGFLVRPTDFGSIRKIMRACTCIWGGVFNPIIPVFRVAPAEWKAKPFEGMAGADVTKGYIDFFEPDVFVEAEEGLLEKAGLAALRGETFRRLTGTLAEFLSPRNDRSWAEPLFGLE